MQTFIMGFQLIKNPLARSAQEELITDYYNNLKPHFKRCSERDVTLFTEDNIAILKEVNMRDKWLDNTVNDETREVIWEYILELNKLSQMCVGLFSQIPSATLDRIQQTAMALAGKISSGELSAGDLDLSSIGQEVVDGLSEEEIASFTENLLSDPSALANLASGMAGTSGLNIDPVTMAQAMAWGTLFEPGRGGGGRQHDREPRGLACTAQLRAQLKILLTKRKKKKQISGRRVQHDAGHGLGHPLRAAAGGSILIHIASLGIHHA